MKVIRGAVLCGATVFVASISMVTQVEARKASCLVPHDHDNGRKLFSFDIDDTAPPYIFNVDGIDGGASGEPVIDILPFDSATAKFQTWYYGNVKMEADGQKSKFEIAFGELNMETGQLRVWEQYALYVNWEYGTAGWLNEDAMYLDEVLKKKPQVVARVVSCRRMD